MRSRDGKLLATINSDSSGREPGVLHAIQPGARLTLTRRSQVLVVDGAVLDDLLSHMHQADSLSSLADTIADRVSVLVHAQPFAQMTLDQVCKCAEAMTKRAVAAGDEVIRYAGHGDYFYVLEEGEAEVLRPDARTGDLVRVATLQAGASFGEEALLRGGLRNATVRMTTPGTLLCLSVADFDRLIADHFVHEVSPEVAHSLISRRQADLIDCRYFDEYDVWRIPGARLVPLDQIRNEAETLDKNKQIVVYCRSGRRSRAAAFILRQEGFTAMFIAGGIAAWPYQHEGERGPGEQGVPPV